MSAKKTRRIVKSKRYLLKKKVTYFIVAVSAVALASFLVYYALGPKNSVIDATPKIAVVDQLSAMWPDPAFNQTIQGILNQTGLKVDYYPSEDVTVDFYRNLPSRNYKLIIFRVHSTAESFVSASPLVVFFTSEKYNESAHLPDQWNQRVAYVKFNYSDQLYFGITPNFVADSMEGRFKDTTIIAMGCEGLKYNVMAEAFIEKGAKAYISWNGFVSADHTDEATECLLRHLVTEKKTVEEAVAQTMNEVGPDPTDNSILLFYPDRAGTNLLLANATATAPAVTAARRKTKEIGGNSGTTLVPTISTL
jgi:hypothetical protein